MPFLTPNPGIVVHTILELSRVLLRSRFSYELAFIVEVTSLLDALHIKDFQQLILARRANSCSSRFTI